MSSAKAADTPTAQTPTSTGSVEMMSGDLRSGHRPGDVPKHANPFIPLSVDDFLFSLARTPTPTRFERRHHRLLQERPRLARAQVKSDRPTTGALEVEVVPSQDTRISRRSDISFTVQLQAQAATDTYVVQENPEGSQGQLTKESIQLAHLAISNLSAKTNDRRQADEELNGRHIDLDEQQRTPSTEVWHALQHCEVQESRNDDYEGSRMFVPSDEL
jgi:hypothetical protein